MKRLRRLLDVADRKRKRLDDLKSLGVHGEKQVKEELWVDAMKSASGEKTVSDSSKLKKAIKRREKKKESSARKWKVHYESNTIYYIHQCCSQELFNYSFNSKIYMFSCSCLPVVGTT
jgi:hypothetical protein